MLWIPIEGDTISPIRVLPTKVISMPLVHILLQLGRVSRLHIWTTQRASHIALHLTPCKQTTCRVVVDVLNANNSRHKTLKSMWPCHINYKYPCPQIFQFFNQWLQININIIKFH